MKKKPAVKVKTQLEWETDAELDGITKSWSDQFALAIDQEFLDKLLKETADKVVSSGLEQLENLEKTKKRTREEILVSLRKI